MKKLLSFALILTLMLSLLTLPILAEGEDGEVTDSVENYTALTHSMEMPEEFLYGEFFDFYWYSDGVGIHENSFTSADGLTVFEYVYMKAYEGEDKSTAFPKEEAYIVCDFEVQEDGVYDFLIEVMAFETYIPRTGLVQIDNGEKFYVNSTHGTNHETWEYFSGLSAYLPAGDHTLTIYLGPDFDDSTVKSLFFDNFYYLLNEDAEIPDLTIPSWDENKDIVTHQSFDELRKNGDGAQGVFTPGASDGWNLIAEVDTQVNSLAYWGWVGLTSDVGTFGYQIDDGEEIYADSYTVEAEQSVQDAAAGTGASTASRMLIDIDVSELIGEHNVKVLYKDSFGAAVLLKEFTVNRVEAAVTETDDQTGTETETEADDDTDTETDTQSETAGETTTETVGETGTETTTDTETAAGTEADSQTAAATETSSGTETSGATEASSGTAADTKADDEGGCASVVSALSVIALFAVAAILRRKED